MTWSAAQYLQFEDDRTRPVRDLVAAIPNAAARRTVDLGCGPGNSTELLRDRFPDAAVTGLDSSADMLEAARKRGRVGGRPPLLSPAQKEEVRRMRDEELRPIASIAQLFKVSGKTVRRA